MAGAMEEGEMWEEDGPAGFSNEVEGEVVAEINSRNESNSSGCQGRWMGLADGW
jgi:hypothetical protein